MSPAAAVKVGLTPSVILEKIFSLLGSLLLKNQFHIQKFRIRLGCWCTVLKMEILLIIPNFSCKLTGMRLGIYVVVVISKAHMGLKSCAVDNKSRIGRSYK